MAKGRGSKLNMRTQTSDVCHQLSNLHVSYNLEWRWKAYREESVEKLEVLAFRSEMHGQILESKKSKIDKSLKPACFRLLTTALAFRHFTKPKTGGTMTDDHRQPSVKQYLTYTEQCWTSSSSPLKAPGVASAA